MLKRTELLIQPSSHVVTGLRSRNISVCCAMTKNGMLSFKAQTRTYNAVLFIEFLNEVFEKLILKEILGAIFIMDNVPFHKIHEVKRIGLAAGHYIKYLPPYSLFLNPIENIFAAWKEYVRRARS